MLHLEELPVGLKDGSSSPSSSSSKKSYPHLQLLPRIIASFGTLLECYTIRQQISTAALTIKSSCGLFFSIEANQSMPSSKYRRAWYNFSVFWGVRLKLTIWPSNECQVRHLKCRFWFKNALPRAYHRSGDLTKPCRPCTEEGRQCVEQLKYQFRHEFNPSVPSRPKRGRSRGFQSSQTWSKVPKRSLSCSSTKLRSLTYVSVRFSDCKSALGLQIQDLESVSGDPPDKEVGCGEPANEVQPTPLATDQSDLCPSGDESYHHILRPSEDHILVSPFRPESSRITTYSFDQAQPLWPLRQKEEALLLQYFSTDLALWVSLL